MFTLFFFPIKGEHSAFQLFIFGHDKWAHRKVAEERGDAFIFTFCLYNNKIH